ncbi:MAG: ribosome biogenesis GTPase YlqF, partial [Clostridia bacterium]|nr:ribosome biogenesis GTPase YlqF [Clostridia bacterium]
MEINWYPGHMARAKRLLSDQLSRVDVVIELCDARLPLSSRNPDLKRLTEKKERVLLLGKSDLADPALTSEWLNLFKRQGLSCMALDMNRQAKAALSLIEKAARETVERSAQRGIKKTVRAMVVGVPNVGKSTLINRLHGGSIAKVGDMPGVTRANQWVKVTPYLELLDT